MSNAWCKTSVRVYLSVTKTHPRISGGCIGGWRLGCHFWHLHRLISNESGSFLNTVSDLISYLIFDIPISRKRCTDIMICTMTCKFRTKERHKMLMKHSNEAVKQNFTSVKPTSLTAAVSFNFLGCVRRSKSFQSCLVSGSVAVTHLHRCYWSFSCVLLPRVLDFPLI